MLEIAGGILLALLALTFWPVILVLAMIAVGIAAIGAAVALVIAYPVWGTAAMIFIGALAFMNEKEAK